MLRRLSGGVASCWRTRRIATMASGKGRCPVLDGRLVDGLRNQCYLGRGLEKAGVELEAIHVLEIDGSRMLAGFLAVDVADAMGRQVYLPILLVGQLVLSVISQRQRLS